MVVTHSNLKSTRVFLENPTPENRAKLPEWLNFEGTRGTYTDGVPERLLPLFAQESWHLDWQNLSSHIEEYFELFKDYGRHIKRFDEIAEYHKKYQPPCLVLWGGMIRSLI